MGAAPDLIRGDGRPTLFRDPHTRGPVLCETSAGVKGQDLERF